MSRQVWVQAHDAGCLIDEAIDELRDLQGSQRLPTPQACLLYPMHNARTRPPRLLPTFMTQTTCTCFSVAQPAPITSPFEAQLRLDFATAWNTKVRGFYDTVRQWAF